ncbi:MAG TPA: superoxide dismutase family protein [Oligoflexus sp.]|uniref:superoxide dismutase family protein n=1 Tax=Oligoflexus sp. TaxID=1971216 RepID=UPI002D4F4E51|nr:superoxide dismutase family protein [Oligoflexus sp.]HYX33368.1 superoxide dismutase family protein [Oligoflexus sp.]
MQLTRTHLAGIFALSMSSCYGCTREKSNEKKAVSPGRASAANSRQALGEAALEPKNSSTIAGNALFSVIPNGVKVVVNITGGTPGRLGIHIHEKGDCSATDASSAGGHFNPTGSEHSGPDHSVRHVGDLGNIFVEQDGTGLLVAEIGDPKGFSEWDSIVGKSVVIHEKADDFKTQPTGDSGKRVACGVIRLSDVQ